MSALNRHRVVHSLAALTLLALNSPALAAVTVLFHDSFEIPAMSNDVNSTLGTPRQSGTLGPIAYVERSSTESGGSNDVLTRVYHNPADLPGTGALHMTARSPEYIWVSPDHNFLESSNFTVSYRTRPMFWGGSGGSSSSNWTSLVVGADAVGAYPTFDPWATENFAESEATQGLGLVIRQNGEYLLYNFAPADSVTPDYTGALTVPTDGEYRVELHVRSDAFDGSNAHVKLLVNNETILDFIRPYGFTSNYITLGGGNFHSPGGQSVAHSFDDLTVAIPEVGPFTLLLLIAGLIAITCVGNRRNIRSECE